MSRSTPRLLPYAELPAVRARQAAGDVAVLAVVVLLAVVARAVHEAVQRLGAPGRQLQEAGTGLQDALARAAERVDGVPLAGGALRVPLDSAAGSGAALRRAGEAQEGAVDRLALLLALVVLLPGLVLLLRHVLRRVEEARETAALSALRTDVDLLALRAALRAPLQDLAGLGPAPVTAWRAGDARAAAGLAALELRRRGLRPAPGGSPAPDGVTGPAGP